MLTNEFRIFDPLKDDVNTVPTLSGNYIFALRKNSKLPDIGIPVIYTKFRDYEVIYVGLASTSLRDRDVEKHFNGNAGSSTLRKSLGCLFGYNLIPRDSHYNNNGKTKFNVTDESELSDWIKTNLLLFYYPNKEFDRIESLLIQALNPPLNLDKNHNVINSEFRKHLSKLRNQKPVHFYDNMGEIMNQRNLGKELYVQIWQEYLSEILYAINSISKTMKLNRSLFESVGNRKKSGYTFRLEIVDGIVPRKKGSAVARDLKKVLDKSIDFKTLANKKSIIISLNKIIDKLQSLIKGLRNEIFWKLRKNVGFNAMIGDVLDYEQPQSYIVEDTEYIDKGTPVLTANKAFILGYTSETEGIYDKGDCIIFDDFTLDSKYVDFPFKVKSSAIKILSAENKELLRYTFEFLKYLDLSTSEHKRHYIAETQNQEFILPTTQIVRTIAHTFSILSLRMETAIKQRLLFEKQKQYLLRQMFI